MCGYHPVAIILCGRDVNPWILDTRGHGRAVVDYWLATAALLPLLPSLEVTGTTMASQHSDHATLLAFA